MDGLMEQMTNSTTAGNPALCTIKETCKTLGIGNTKCYELIASGALEVVRLGSRCTRVRVSSIDRLVAHGAN